MNSPDFTWEEWAHIGQMLRGDCPVCASIAEKLEEFMEAEFPDAADD